MNRTRILCLAWAVLVCVATSAWAADYHVSAAGSDHNSGSADAPWQTIARVNAVSLQPGDRVLFRGGDSFDGSLFLDASDAGTPNAPVTIGSYGSGRATIAAGTYSGIYAYNAAGIRIQQLNVAGGAGNTASGVVFYMDLPATKLSWIRLDSLDVSGFGRDGIEIGAWNGTSGFKDVRITGVTVHHNARTGILTYAQQPAAHESVYVGYSRAFENPGIPEATGNTGSGIVLGGVSGGTIEWCVAFGNGRLSRTTGGPVGIWTYDSTRVLIQYNESFANRTAGASDGGGFDLDQNVTDSVLQFNYSHDNDGAGYLLAHGPASDAHHGNIVRHNVSVNDGRRNSYGGIEIWGRVLAAQISNNTVRISPSVEGTPSALRAWSAGAAGIADGVILRDNIFEASGGLAALNISDSQQGGLRFEMSGTAGAGPGPDIVLRAADAGVIAGGWRMIGDASASGGVRLWHPDRSAPKLMTPLAAPGDFFEVTFNAQAGRGYRLWMRAQAESDYWGNDSVFAQFSGSLNASAGAAWRIGTESALEVRLEACNGCGLSGWGWEDVGWGTGVLGPLVYFAADGPQTLRVQTREDGMSIDQIVLSSETFLTRAPGTGKNDSTMLPITATIATGSGSGEGTPPPPPPPPDPDAAEIVIYAADVPATAVKGDWVFTSSSTAAAGVALRNPDRGVPKLMTAAASPASFFDVTFTAQAGIEYQLWLRMRADNDHYTNDSVYLQFSGAVDAFGAAVNRIGTTGASVVSLQDTVGAPISDWGWNDTGWASVGVPVRFATSGPQTLRIQQREDGIAIDQIVLSSGRYLLSSPGALTSDATIIGR